jgi:CheY-like chemotaxis protein
VFWNLLSNAVKFTPRGGSIQVELNERDGLVEVLIRDSGEGIAPEFLPYVFDRFRQGDASTTRRHGGLGLGLSIVKQLVELHGGTVRVESERHGAGTTFTVSLPLTGDEPFVDEAEHAGTVVNLASLPAREQEYARDGIELSGLRVVVLDDEPDARLFVKRLLEDRGAEATVVATASDAFELVRSGTFDALLSDIGMPGEDGYSLIERVRALSPDCGGSVPAIALTAYARQADRARALAAGFSAHLSKPLQPATLVQELGRITGRARNSRIPPSNGDQQ